MRSTMEVWQMVIAWLLSMSCCQCWELTIIHTNDMHAWLDKGSNPGGICTEPGHCYGGFPRIKHFVDSIRKARNNTLFLNAGDNFQGTTYYSLYKWKAIEKFIDIMGIDVMSLGNHEFDDGLDGIVPYLRSVKTPWVCANLKTENEPSFRGVGIQPWKLFNVQGRTVAVIGYLTPETKYMAWTGNLTLLDEVTSLNKAVRGVRRRGADVVIALGHSGWDRDLEIARDVPGIDLLVGGHSHTFHYTGHPPDKEIPVSSYPHMVVQASGKIVPVVQAFAYTKYVGLLHLSFTNNNRIIRAIGNPVLMDHTIPEDEDMLKLLDVWKANSSKLLQKPIGRIKVDLISEPCRLNECNIGNFITDAMIDHRKRQLGQTNFGWTDAPIALINSGDIRASLKRKFHDGVVTLGDLLTSMPYDETLVKIKVNGSVFKEVLEHSVHKYDPTGASQGGQFLQLSGVKVVYDLGRKEGSRVVSASVRCGGTCSTPVYWTLTPDSNIDFLTTGFVSNGGDGYSMLSSAHKESIGSTTYFNVVKKYIRRMSPVNIETEGRIKIL